jgi:hypothetical protein
MTQYQVRESCGLEYESMYGELKKKIEISSSGTCSMAYDTN